MLFVNWQHRQGTQQGTRWNSHPCLRDGAWKAFWAVSRCLPLHPFTAPSYYLHFAPLSLHLQHIQSWSACYLVSWIQKSTAGHTIYHLHWTFWTLQSACTVLVERTNKGKVSSVHLLEQRARLLAGEGYAQHLLYDGQADTRSQWCCRHAEVVDCPSLCRTDRCFRQISTTWIKSRIFWKEWFGDDFPFEANRFKPLV